MISPTAGLLKAYKEASSLHIDTVIRAEWNFNRYYDAEVVGSKSEDQTEEWEEYFPEAFVIGPRRPSRGVVKARISNISGIFGEDRSNAAGMRVTSEFLNKKPPVRYYIPSNDDFYKYWSSFEVTVGSAVQGSYFFENAPSIQVVYEKAIRMNKITIGLETSEAVPRQHEVFITGDGRNWSRISTNPTVGSDGRIVLFYDGSAWSSNRPANTSMKASIRGIRYVARSMSKLYAPLSVIEVAGMLEEDLSRYLISESSDFEISDTSAVSPIGVASSNKATMTLDNTTGLFHNDNPDSPYYGIIDRNVRVWCDYILNGETFRKWTMFTDTWQNQLSQEVSVDLFDNAEYLQSIKIPPVFWEGMSAGAIIWRLLDVSGVTDWNYKYDALDVTTIPHYWSDPEKTVWENIQDLASATQTAVYFDEYNVGQVRSARSQFNRLQSPVWNFRSAASGGTMADIVDIQSSADYESNEVTVKFKETKFTDFSNGLPKMQVVWEPEDTVVLRSSPLLYNLTSTQKYFHLTQTDAATWPLEGSVNIEGEIISYKGKVYRAYNFWDNGSYRYTEKVIYKDDERKAMDEDTPEGIRWRNGYSGEFRVTRRGDMGTQAKPHTIDFKKKYTYELTSGGSQDVQHWAGGVTRNPSTSTVTLKGRAGMEWHNFYTLRTTESAKAVNYRYGTRLRIPSGQPLDKGAGGLYIKGGSNNSGFFINLAATEVVEQTERANRNELRFQIRKRDGEQPMKNYIPPPLQISRDTWYDLEATTHLNTDGTMLVNVFVDGVLRYTTNISANEISDPLGRFGVFIQDNCKVEFDYLYAVGSEDNANPDDASFYDNIKGAYMSNYFDKVLPYQKITPGVVNRRTRTVRPTPITGTQQWLEEFGPMVHEIRRFDVDFEKAPVAHSYLYFSNTDQVVCPVYIADAYGATFYLANAFRRNAVVNGEDSLTFGENNTVEQKIFVYGRSFSEEQEKTEIVRDERAIRRRGLIALTIESPYIQTIDTAKNIAEWIIDYQGNGVDEYQLEVFGNPFLQLGDIITITDRAHELMGDEKFCITSLGNGTDQGLSTTLTARRL